MKKVLFAIILMITFAVTYAQKDSAASKIEQAVNTKGYLFKQEVFSVDNIPAFRIDAIKITNLENFSITNGLRIVHKVQIGKELKTFKNYVDYNEIDELTTSLQYIKTILKSKTIPGNYTEIKYTTQSGFQVMLFTVLNIQNKLDWNFVVQTNTTEEKTLITLTNEDIDKLQKVLEQAKSKL